MGMSVSADQQHARTFRVHSSHAWPIWPSALRAQVHSPAALPSDDELAAVHCADYLAAFAGGTLDAARMRRIGFGEATRSAALIRRTKAGAPREGSCGRAGVRGGACTLCTHACCGMQ